MSTTIKIISESGNVDFVVSMFERIISEIPSITFKFAVIYQSSLESTKDKSKKDFFPLALHSDDGLIIKVSEVHCGTNDKNTESLIKILNLAGFKLTPQSIEKIHTRTTVKALFWNEELMKQF